MSAPALITLAHGSRDPRSARVVRDIVSLTKRMRPGLPVEAAFLDHNRPSLDTVVQRLADRGIDEAVVVPLLLSSAYHAQVDTPAAIERVNAARDDINVRGVGVLGLDTSLLSVLDLRLREALRVARARELDALVLASAGSSDAPANAHMARLARTWGNRHRLPTMVAFASASPPSTGEAVRDFRRQGRRHVAVGSLFVAPGVLPDRAAELALEAGAVAVSEPLGAHEVVGRLVLARYSVGAFELVDLPA